MLYPDAGSLQYHKAGACCNVSIINYFLDGLFYVIVVSESYFLYLLSLQKIAGSTLEGGLGNIGLAEPLRVYSNVEGGTGIKSRIRKGNRWK